MSSSKYKPNIVLIVLDTHRLDRLGCYGYPRGTSPNIDAFAQESTVFENAISPAQWTIPAHASMFSGEFPSTHMTLQARDSLDVCFQTLAERLSSNSYRSVGFCNNPLVGVLNNGFKRGFETFYNYGGAIPSVPAKSPKSSLALLNGIWTHHTHLLRKISYPIQNVFAKSNRIFQFVMSPKLVSLWTRYAHFKGDTSGSIRDASAFIRQQMRVNDKQPHFLFINLFETHLPFTPPQTFVDTFAPYLEGERAARDFMRIYNTQALRWLLPMEEPFSNLEAQTLSDMYDAEVAYQDHLLAELLTVLDQPEHRDKTMVILVADHGEMLGEHQLMGHSFGVFQELVHVPLLIRFPGQVAGQRVVDLVSTTQLFHTVLDIAGVEVPETENLPAMDIKGLSLTRVVNGAGPAAPVVFSEAYPPDIVLRIMDSQASSLIDAFHTRSTLRAVYEGQYKLIYVEDEYDELFALDADPLEIHDLAETEGERVDRLAAGLRTFIESARARRPKNWTREKDDLTDKVLLERLRGLGYIE
jgi:uncharacterized sulfatase